MAGSSGSSEPDSDASNVDNAVKTLVAGREKRQKAGNRLGVLLQDEEGDEVNLLFTQTLDEEVADDDFVDNDEAGSEDDVERSSGSSDDESLAAGPAADDLSGERDLQQAEKAEQLKRRRQREPWRGSRSMRTPATKTSAKPDPDTPKPSSRLSESSQPLSRASNVGDGPVRSSLRKHTVQNRKETNQRAREFDERRKQQGQVMEAAAQRRELVKARAMTQADRLAEARRVEELNSKSLNRWETSESKRIEEQKAKFAALRNRRLDGPVTTWLSSPSLWTGEVLITSGAQKVQQHLDKNFGSVPTGSPHGEPANTALTTTEGNRSMTALQCTAGGLPATGKGQPSGMPQSDEVPQSLSQANDGPFHVASRSLVVLQNIVEGAAQPGDMHGNILTQRKRNSGKLSKSYSEPCAITGFRARFRDPDTGLPYANSRAFKESRKLAAGKPEWSGLLGCYVGAPGEIEIRSAPYP